MSTLSIIILNWNAAEDTIRCVQQVQSWQRINPQIFIVDNASSDNSADHIAQTCSTIHLIRNTANLGFAGGNNRAITASLAEGDAPLLLLNNDAFIDEESVLQLLETLHSDSQIGIVGPLLYNAEQREQLLSAGGKTPLHHHTHMDALKPGVRTQTVDYIPGTVILIKAEVFQQVGLLDEDYFFSTEVVDFCLRARRHGYRSVVDSQSHAFHNLSRSSEFRTTLHTYYIIRNRFLYIRKFHPRTRLLLDGIWAFYSLLLAAKTHWIEKSPATAKAMMLGVRDGLQGRFGGRNEEVLAQCRMTP
ncbi:MAG: glycosyltransferase family 2 protein [Anaerolineales bacterium]|nr:glycosyltransferase family 2 protein [Anaerolineales bacterium]